GIAQQDDPSEIFLKAYLSAQQAEKLEHQDRFKNALAKYRFAGSLIEELRKSHAQWQPAVVEYRGRKISEGILRLQERTTRQTQLNASASPLPDIAPAAPESDAWSEPGPEALAPQSMPTVTEPSRDTSSKVATKNLRDKVAELQAALDKTRGDLQTTRKEKDLVDTRLNETNSLLERARNDLDDAKKSERQTRDQLTELQEPKASQTIQATNDKEEQQLRADVAQLKGAVAAAEQARVTAEKQRDDTQAKFAEADNHIATLERERGDALSQLKLAKESEQRFQSLVAEKDDLQQKLAAAEQQVGKVSQGDPNATDKLAAMERQITELQHQLTETQNRNHYLAARAAELDVELEHAGKELQTATMAEVNTEDSSRVAKENELLRNIVVRERQEEARRDEAWKGVLAELGRLKVRSDLLNKQMEFLAQPITKLTREELALFRQPVVSLSNEKAGVLKMNFVFEKKSTADVDKSNPMSTAAPTSLPNELQEIALAARVNIEQGKYRTAEKQYQTILAKDAENLDALSNLGVVYFRTGKIRSAESTLKKALTIAPDDDFVLTTLGIVHYRQSKFDEALKELRKAIELNPNSATAHNYLGITASQKGRQQEAEKEMLQAISKDPNYADAHFNLAVILVTTQPPSRELAKEHYARATALGTQPSPSLETLLQ
ncbi:MAG TPA: tetratricopeptide repeat protein, partial [Candidatus Acidoferrum sp.]|nr:tetratricopeptide repeat protein [Candidatus Acidoferrum sp.]